MNDMAEFKIGISPTGRGEVILDGVNVSNSVEGLMIQAKPGNVPIVTLYHASGTAEIEGVGIVQVSSDAPDRNRGEIVRKWLGEIDPAALESAVLDRADFGASPIMDALQVLMEWTGT